MPDTESTPLLASNGPPNSRPLRARIISRIKAEGEPTWSTSLNEFLLKSWLNVLLVFIPLSAASHFQNWDAGLRFAFSFVAIIPLAKLLGDATEQLSMKLGQTVGGLLNASFGNAVEIIVGITALLQGELRIVQTSMLGSILSNILLVLGMSFFVGGLYKYENKFAQTAAQNSASVMTLSCITLVIPAAYHASQLEEHWHRVHNDTLVHQLRGDDLPGFDNIGISGLLTISRGTSILLLFIYLAYLYFQLKSHAHLFETSPPDTEEEGPKMSMISAAACLLIVTLITSFCADWLVASIEETAEKYKIPKAFIGLILLPLVANAAEHVTSVWMAAKDKMELTMAISLGSSIQISTLVVPLLVLVGWMTNRDLTLYFANFETITLFVSVILVCLLVQDGRSNYLEGLILVVLYIVIALAVWVS